MIFEKILLGIDGSEDSLRAAIRTLELSKKHDSKVVVFYSTEHHLLTEMAPAIAMGGGTIVTEGSANLATMRFDNRRRGTKLLDDTKKLFETENASIETRLILDEAPEAYIKRVVKEEGFDLVVLGCKGDHSKLKRTLIGTVPEKVLNEVPCDVLIIR